MNLYPERPVTLYTDTAAVAANVLPLVLIDSKDADPVEVAGLVVDHGADLR
ncbi:hypothetical protein [Dietzia sp. B32]|uniref:hypothetical protein n=1 Tax=Dietzia sp. B32 TaxID=2915130 RepID=UPI0021AD59D4|nr:hypothetical protein [Dietzia sp. B32]UVE97073.1 hypothetical protein L8M95_12800 [Dietzia sp. B32]